MESPKRALLVGTLSAVLLLLLLITPPTGRIARTQLATVFRPRLLLSTFADFGVTSDEAPAENPVSPSYPADDYLMTLARTLMLPSSTPEQNPMWWMQNANKLRSLLPRYGNRPSLHANILRYMTQAAIPLHRPEEDELAGTVGLAEFTPHPVSIGLLTAYDSDAAAGERLDPDNAFFPLMRAIELFAANRDTEALAAVKRAGQKNRWEDYVQDETAGRLLLTGQTIPGRTEASQMRVRATILYPHYAGLRSAARVAAVKAMEAERKGHIAEGIAIRHSLMHCGVLLRELSKATIGKLIGVAIIATAVERPGGAPPIKSESNPLFATSAAHITQRRAAAYLAFLEKTGHANEARWAQEQLMKNDRIRDQMVQHRIVPPRIFQPNAPPQLDSAAWWLGSQIVLFNVVGMLLVSVAALLLLRSGQTEGGQPLLLIAGLLLMSTVFASSARWNEAFVAFRHTLAGPTSVAATSGMVLTHKETILSFLAQPLFACLAAILLSLAAPLTTIGILFNRSLRSKEKWLEALIRGLAQRGLLVAYLTIILYGALAWATASVEARFHLADPLPGHKAHAYSPFRSQLISPLLPLLNKKVTIQVFSERSAARSLSHSVGEGSGGEG